jgi:hypothetical protein
MKALAWFGTADVKVVEAAVPDVSISISATVIRSVSR